MKNKIVLINFLPDKTSNYEKKGNIYPSTALLLIGSFLKKHSYDVKIIDGAYYEDYLSQLKRYVEKYSDEIIYVGMYVMITQIPFALKTSMFLKNLKKDITIVWGGPHVTLYPKQTLRNENVDIVVINEGAFTSIELAECLKKKKDLDKVKGICYKNEKNNIIFTSERDLDEIDKLPFFDYDLIDVEKYLSPHGPSVYAREFPEFKDEIKIMPILTALGCPYKCQFCINVILKRKYRFRSADSIIEEIKRLQKKYSANTFLFLDEDFLISKKRFIDFISLAKKENLKFNVRAWCRVDHFKDNYLNEKILKDFSKIGHISLVMGGESANQDILNDLQKGITPHQVINSLQTISNSNKNIFPRYSFMVGLENESMNQIINTYRFCYKLKEINPRTDISGPFAFRLYPGSPIFDRLVKKYNIITPRSLESWSKEITSTGNLSDMPWAPKEFRKKYKLIDFYFNLSLHSFEENWKKPRKSLKYLLSKISKVRVGKNMFHLPFEYWIYNLLKNMKRLKFD